MVAEFGAITGYPDRQQGLWTHEGKLFEDASVKVTIEVEDSPITQSFFLRFKETLKRRFRQMEIWIVSYEVRIH